MPSPPFTVMLTKVSIHVCSDRSSEKPWMPTFVGMTTSCLLAPYLSNPKFPLSNTVNT
jgi:hypothetical protein